MKNRNSLFFPKKNVTWITLSSQYSTTAEAGGSSDVWFIQSSNFLLNCWQSEGWRLVFHDVSWYEGYYKEEWMLRDNYERRHVSKRWGVLPFPPPKKKNQPSTQPPWLVCCFDVYLVVLPKDLKQWDNAGILYANKKWSWPCPVN